MILYSEILNNIFKSLEPTILKKNISDFLEGRVAHCYALALLYCNPIFSHFYYPTYNNKKRIILLLQYIKKRKLIVSKSFINRG